MRRGTPRNAAERSGTPGVEIVIFCVRAGNQAGRRLAAATKAGFGHSFGFASPLCSLERSGTPRNAAERRGTLGHAGRRDCHFHVTANQATGGPSPRRGHEGGFRAFQARVDPESLQTACREQPRHTNPFENPSRDIASDSGSPLRPRPGGHPPSTDPDAHVRLGAAPPHYPLRALAARSSLL